jgi:hypothetical protein
MVWVVVTHNQIPNNVVFKEKYPFKNKSLVHALTCTHGDKSNLILLEHASKSKIWILEHGMALWAQQNQKIKTFSMEDTLWFP